MSSTLIKEDNEKESVALPQSILLNRYHSIIKSNILWAVVLPGALGGFIFWFIKYQSFTPFKLSILYSPVYGPIVSIICGAFAGLLSITVLTEIRDSNQIRMLGISFIAGMTWQVIIGQAMVSITGEVPLNAFRSNDGKMSETSVVIDEREKKLSHIERSDFTEQQEDYLNDADLILQIGLDGLLASINSSSGLSTYIRDAQGVENLNADFILLKSLGILNEFESLEDIELTEKGRELSIYLDNIQTSFNAKNNNFELPENIKSIEFPILNELGSFQNSAEIWYQFTVGDREPSNYDLWTSSVDNLDDTDTVITLYNSNKEKIGDDDDGGVDGYSHLVEELSSGLYYLKVESYFGERIGNYYLNIASQLEGTAPSINSPTYYSGEIGPVNNLIINNPISTSYSFIESGQRFWFSFSIPESEGGSIDLVIETFASGDFDDTDTVISVFKNPSQNPEDNAALEFIGNDDDGGTFPYSKLTESVSSGSYYLLIENYEGSLGEFRVSINTN